MEHFDELIALPLEQFFAKADDDMYTNFSGDALSEDMIDFNLDVTNLYEEEDTHLANVDWDKVESANVNANWHEDDPTMSLLEDEPEQTQKKKHKTKLEIIVMMQY